MLKHSDEIVECEDCFGSKKCSQDLVDLVFCHLNTFASELWPERELVYNKYSVVGRLDRSEDSWLSGDFDTSVSVLIFASI